MIQAPEVVTRIADLDASHWDRLCPNDYPFTRHAFLAALEHSGSLSPERGWQPHHLVWRENNGQLAAAMPVYLKTHSFGEYVFDWAWADAYDRNGLDYYPKLLAAIPFTPCQGPRLLAGGAEPQWAGPAAEALSAETRRLGLSGWHCLFPDPELSDAWRQQGAAQRLGCQFHWFNRGYRDFDDFLAGMNSRKRKNIRKERRQLQDQGFTFEWRQGTEIRPQDWALFYRLYQLTYLKRSGHGGYLTQNFFELLGEQMAQQCLMILAYKAGTPIAAALFLTDSRTLYGRYWGCRAEFDFLHFETCYYQGLDYAIARGLTRFDGGAQGEHKLARGFEPCITYSNHWLAHSGFQAAVQEFVTEEALAIQAYSQAAREQLPFKNPTQE